MLIPFLSIASLCLLVAALVRFVYAPMPRSSGPPGESRAVVVDGRSRGFVVWAPPELPPGAPLLLVLHGSLMTGTQMRRMLGPRFERLARQRGAVLAYPDGVEGHFNDGRVAASYSARTLDIDDVGFMHAIVDALALSHGIDRRRVFAFGYSNGGHMAMRLAAEAPDLVAGIIVSNANVPTSDNMGWTLSSRENTPATRAVLLEGTRDPINPYAGGRVTIFGFGDRGTVLSSLDSARWFARRGGVSDQPTVETNRRCGGLDVRQQDWGSPAVVRLVTMNGAGHTVPQSDYRFSRFLGKTVRDDAILEAAWDLVSRSPT
jgi:polyhydroxybutyrate depolymerase